MPAARSRFIDGDEDVPIAREQRNKMTEDRCSGEAEVRASPGDCTRTTAGLSCVC
jgi:hypothetical protein